MDTPPSTPAVKKRLHQQPLVQIFTVFIVQAATLTASVYKAKVEAKAKAAETHLQAEAGYAVTKGLAAKWEERYAEQAVAIAKLQGQVQILAQQLDHHTDEWRPVRPPRTPEPAPGGAYDAVARVQRAVAPPVVKMKIPVDLEDAVQWGRGKK